MSSHSPRGSLSGASTSAEVAADFEESLRDLQNNNRYEISNLTIIAKENTEHAQAISRALESHIKTVRLSCNLSY
jgi:pre-mRNA cleavage complex 2 protein Pcf11